jgi:protein O-GlcNAc transferase
MARLQKTYQKETPVPQLMESARVCRRSGKLAEAEALYRKVLAQCPDNGDALHLLGLVVFDLGKGHLSPDLIRRAMAVNPSRSDYAFNLGTVFTSLGKRDEAIRAFERALSQRADFVEAALNLSSLLVPAGRAPEAIDICKRALTHGRMTIDLTYNLGVAYQANRQLDDAVSAYQQVLALMPKHLMACNNLGVCLQLLRRPKEAEAVYRKLVEMSPEAGHAHINLGEILRLQGRNEEAVAECRRGVELDPQLREGNYNLGLALRAAGDLDGAVEAYCKSIAAFPDHAESYNNMGNALKDMGRVAEAIDSYRRAITISPDHVDCDSNLMLAIHYSQDYHLPAVVEELRKWNQRRAVPLRGEIRAHDNQPDPDRRLRIGYVSADFRYHACSFFLAPLLRHHDHQAFEIFLYSQLDNGDWMTEKFQSYADQWRKTIGVSDKDVAEQIRRDKIDILVDAKLHCAENRLMVLAHKPAPIQVSWLGYPGSSGLETMDYRVSDENLEPGGSVYPFAEQPIQIQDCFWSYDPLASEPAVNALPALSVGHVTFGSLNNFCKNSDLTLRLWASALNAVPDSRLHVLAPKGSARKRFVEKMTGHGIDAGRIEFLDHIPREDYLKYYHRIDICLDTLPYNGHTTSLDALWMGVPVVTLPGGTPPGRVGVTHAKNLKMPELVASGEQDFSKVAAKLASDLPALDRLRQSLRGRMEKSPLMDGPGFARKMEQAYRQIWKKWCDGKSR